MDTKTYVGNELELFSKAINWKRYFGSKIVPRIGDRVLEVGAGLAETTPCLCCRPHKKWLCLEPDEALCKIIQSKLSSSRLPNCCSVYNGTIKSLAGRHLEFDTILYIDVLEHIENDRDELKRAAGLLSKNGEVIILSPAHMFLFSTFDRQIGHWRRYNKRRIQRACPRELSIVHTEYLDSVGMLASLANRWFLGQPVPTAQQINLWDNVMVQAAKLLDRLFLHAVGKSILAILQLEKFASRG